MNYLFREKNLVSLFAPTTGGGGGPPYERSVSFYICNVIGSFCFSPPAWHKLRLCYTRPMAAKLTDNKTLFCHSDDRKNLIFSRYLCFTTVFTINTFVVYSICSHSLLTFCRAKSYKNARHKFLQVAPVLCSCHLGEHSVECRLSFVSAVPISGTKELASRIHSIVWHTRSDTFVLFPLLGLTRAVAQHHAGFVFGITLVCENRRGRPMYLLDIVPLS